MKSYRASSLLSAAALAALGACSGPNPARLAAEADVEAASIIPCAETPRLFFAPDGRGAVGCNLSGAVRLIDQAPMVTSFGPGNVEGEQMRMITAVMADDDKRFCVAQTSVVGTAAGQRVGTLYSFVDTEARHAAVIAGQPIGDIPAVEDPNLLPADLSCRAGIEARTRLVLSRIVDAIAAEQARNTI